LQLWLLRLQFYIYTPNHVMALGVGADPFESTQNDSRRLCSCFTIHSKETCVWRRLRLGSKGNRRHKDNQVTIRGCTSFFLPSGGGRGVVPVPFRWCPAGERLVPSVRRCPPCLLSAGWFGVLFPAILSCVPLRSCITRKKPKRAMKTNWLWRPRGADTLRTGGRWQEKPGFFSFGFSVK
jgi:hypothetical protein